MRPQAGHSMMAQIEKNGQRIKRIHAHERFCRKRIGSTPPAARSNIQAGTSSQRSASEASSVQRKTTPSALSITAWTQTSRPNHG